MFPFDRDLRHSERGTELWKAVMLRGIRGCPLQNGALCAGT